MIGALYIIGVISNLAFCSFYGDIRAQESIVTKFKKPSIAVLGAGYWGINLVRNFRALGVLSLVCDPSPTVRESMSANISDIATSDNFQDALKNPDIQAVAIATPAATHYEIAHAALESGKDVFVEKPLSLKTSDAQKLLNLSKEKKRILMVGHLLQYHPGVVKLKELVHSGELGSVEYIYSNRLNLGKIRNEENALWSFAPHDISVMLWLVGSMPIQVNAVGGSYLQPNVADTTISTFVFNNGVRGHIYVSWLHPFKEQRLVVVGSKRMLTFDDRAAKGQKLFIYEKKVSLVRGQFVAERPLGSSVVFDEEIEPLRAECEHFAEAIQTRKMPRTDGEEGLRVLRVLQCCERSLQMNGQPVQVMDYRD